MIKTDLEALTGKLVMGDYTEMVYDLLKDSPHKVELLKYSHLLLRSDLVKEIKGGIRIVNRPKEVAVTEQEIDSRVSLENWLSDRGIK